MENSSNNTPSLSFAVKGETQDDVDFLTQAREEFAARGETLYVGWTNVYVDQGLYWRCGHPRWRPTFGATRREAVELMIVQCVTKRLSGEPIVTSMRKHLKKVFSG